MKRLSRYKEQVEKDLRNYESHLGPENPLRQACCYTLRTEGKRLRPIISLLVAEALGKGIPVNYGGLTAELFHSASLVADDLPCMDDDDERRNQPSCHKKFGEGMALLVSYALIAAGYDCLHRNRSLCVTCDHGLSPELADRACVLALETATRCTGVLGATGGQFLDLAPGKLSEGLLLEIFDKKTGSLFEIAFVNGWLFGGGDEKRVHDVCQLALHFGRAFQIVDDLGDLEEDAQHEGSVNFAAFCGVSEAMKKIKEEVSLYEKKLEELKISSEELKFLGAFLLEKAEEEASTFANDYTE